LVVVLLVAGVPAASTLIATLLGLSADDADHVRDDRQ